MITFLQYLLITKKNLLKIRVLISYIYSLYLTFLQLDIFSVVNKTYSYVSFLRLFFVLLSDFFLGVLHKSNKIIKITHKPLE